MKDMVNDSTPLHIGSIDVANGPQAPFKPPVIPDLNLSPQGSISQSDKATVPHLNTPSSEKHVEDISGVQAEVELKTWLFNFIAKKCIIISIAIYT